MADKAPDYADSDWVWIGYPDTGGTAYVQYGSFRDLWGQVREARLLTAEEIAATTTLNRHVMGPALLTLTDDERSVVEQTNPGITLEAPKAAERKKAEKEMADKPAADGAPSVPGHAPVGPANP